MKKILVVDDHPDALNVMEMQLSRVGAFEVLQAYSGREAVEAFRKDKPDIVFMDITMPGLNGYEAMRAIRKEEGGAATPVIAWSTLLSSELGDAKSAGFNDYLCKFGGEGLSLRDILKKYGLGR